MNFLNKLDWFIPDSIKQREDIAYRAKQLVVFSFMGPLFFIPNIVKWVSLGSLALGVSMFLVMILILVYPFALKLSGNHLLSSNWVIVCLAWHFIYLPYLTGGFHSTALFWLIALPVFAVGFIGIGSATFWAIFSLIEIVTWYLLDKSGVVINSILTRQSDINSTIISNLIGPLLAILLTLWFVNRGRTSLYAEQQKAIKKQELTLLELKNIVENVDSTISTIKNVSENLSQATDELTESSQTMKENTKKISEATGHTSSVIEDVNIAAKEVSSQVSMSSKSISESSDNKKEIGQETQKVSMTINSISKSLVNVDSVLKDISNETQNGKIVSKDASEKAEATASIINKLGSSTEEINEVMDLIKGIASQTSLLALNANIEAASAGEAGKGFAIVANEVKELSRQTAVATDNIFKKVESMKLNANMAVDAISGIVTVMVDVNKIMNSTAESLTDQTVILADISNLMQGTAVSAGIMTTNVQEANQLDLQNSQSIENISISAAQIANHTEQAKEDTVLILNNMKDMDHASDISSQNTAEVKKQVSELEKLVNNLSQLIEKID
jgi:methyl-accepting chemotaxis protein